MTLKRDPFSRGIAFSGLGSFFGWLVLSGRIQLLLKPGLIWMTALSAGMLLLLGINELGVSMAGPEPRGHDHFHECSKEHESHSLHEAQCHGRPEKGWIWGAIAFLLPAAIGILTPPMALDSDAAVRRGLGMTASHSSSHFGNDFLEQVDTVLRSGSPRQTVDLVGFVTRLDGAGPGEFMLTRFLVSCCAADAVPIGVRVIWELAGSLRDNQWVRVRGQAKAESWNGRPGVVIRPDVVERVEAPAVPYVYPNR